MSTLTVTNIKATGETASRAVSGVAAAWANFTGVTTTALRDSFNVSSLTDVSTGNTSVALSSNMNNSDYSVSGAANHDSYFTDTLEPFSYAASSFSVGTYSRGSSSTGASGTLDLTYVNVTIHGDLA
jgi:hypothetical protein